MTESGSDLLLDPLVVTTLNAAPYAVLLVADDGRIVFDNPQADMLFGCAVGALEGRGVEELMPERFRDAHAGQRDDFTRHGMRRPIGQRTGLVAIGADGTEMPVQISLSRLALGGQTVTMAVVVALDAQHAAPPDASSLQRWTDASGELYHRLVQTAPIGIYRSSPDGLLLYANPALAHMLGYEDISELLGVNLARDVYAEAAERTRVLRRIEEGAGSSGVHARLRRRDGTVITARITSHAVRDDSGAIVCYEGGLVDVTDRIRMEEELHRMRGMESATRLASGVSHTLNNVLTSVLGNLQLALEDLRVDAAPVNADLEEAEQGLLRATEMLAKLRSFSSVDLIRPEPLDLRSFILEWVDRFAPGPGITVHVSVPEDPVEAEVDRAGLVSVLDNLAANAVDAMPEGGEILVALAASVDGGNRWAEMEIADSGMGMNEITLDRAMEPYFSTKERRTTSAGAGLGLSLVYGIVRQHGGDVVLTSAPERGTTVLVRLPLGRD